MSLTQSMNSALSGLTAASRSTEVVSTNIANKSTPAYGKRDVVLSAQTLGGVKVSTVTRHTNPVLLGERRMTQSQLAQGETKLNFLSAVENKLSGQTGQGSLLERINILDSALIAASAQPSSEAHLSNVLQSAISLADGIRSASSEVQKAREQAELSIASEVGRVNDALSQVAELNKSIIKLNAMGQDVNGLMDQRQALVDDISSIIPIREMTRDNGAVVLFTSGGATLLDGASAAEIGFTHSGTIRAESGALNELTLNGEPVDMGSSKLLRGGSLSAHFDIRDSLAPAAQAELDNMAEELVQRFADSDSSLDAGEAGLFTDNGSAITATKGLAERIQVNSLANPDEGGALWRLRSGLGASGPGYSGDGSILAELSYGLQRPQTNPSTSLQPAERSFAEFAASISSSIASQRLNLQSEASFTSARNASLTQAEAAEGVDTDFELQNLLIIENAWGANARVIQVVDSMLATLLEL